MNLGSGRQIVSRSDTEDWNFGVRGEGTWSAFGDGFMSHVDQHAALRRSWLAERF